MKLKFLTIVLASLGILLAFSISQLVLNDKGKRNIDIKGTHAQENSKNYKTIGIVVHNMQHMFMANVAGILREKAKEYDNIKVLLYDSEGSNAKQILQLRELIDMKVDGIILNPNDKNHIDRGVVDAWTAGIPVITVNMNVSSDLIHCYIGSDSVQAGEFQGRYVAGRLNGKGNVVVIAGQKGHDATSDRLKGLKNIFRDYPGIHIVEVQYGDWDRHRGSEIMKSILNRHIKFDAVVSHNDEMMLGALSVLDSYGLKTVTIGVDAIPEALEAIKEGRMDATVYQNSRAQAVEAFEVMMKIFKKEPVEKVKLVPYELVTSENIDEYIAQNFIVK